MEEKDGLPIAKVGMSVTEAEELKARLESLMRDGVEPRMIGVRARLVDLSDGSRAVVLRIPRSWNPPHRVIAHGSNRFWVRNSSGAHEASVEELRSLFTLASNTQERIRDFIASRADTIRRGRGPVQLPQTGTLIIHIVSLAAFGQPNFLRPEDARKAEREFRPMADGGRAPRFNIDGFIILDDPSECTSYVQVFRNGVVEIATSGIVSQQAQGSVLFRDFAGASLIEVLPRYLDGLRMIDVPPPFAISVTYIGIGGSLIGVPSDYGRGFAKQTPLPAINPLTLPAVVLDDYPSSEDDCARVLRPILDAVWNGAGFPSCPYYDEQGQWHEPK